MARKAGSIVISRLRDRIRLGRYFGRWSPGDRLPSVREVAELESVDRKTAAAAYRRLQKEGLVRVEPRSGVYLATNAPEATATDPLRRLHRTWLENTLESAAELGLATDTLNRMFQGVAVVERRRIPVVDPDPEHARLLAAELNRRTDLECVPAAPGRLPAESGPLRNPPFLIATPAGAQALEALHTIPIVPLTLAPELFAEVARAVREGPVLVLVGSDALEATLRQALDRQLAEQPHPIQVLRPDSPDDIAQLGTGPERRVVVWPGTPEWATAALEDGAKRPARLVASTTLHEIRCQVARAALEHVSTSSVSATPGETAG